MFKKIILRDETIAIGSSILLVGFAIAIGGKESGKVIAGLLIGASLGLFLDPVKECFVRALLGPKLSIELDRYYPPRTEPHRELYVRLKIQNTKKRTAKGCGAYLADIEKPDLATGRLGPTVFHDTFPLHWAYDAALVTVDLPQRVPRYLDLVSVDESQGGIRPHHLGLPPNQGVPLYQELWDKSEKLRFTVVVTAEGIEPEVRRITVDRRGEWEPKLEIEKP